MNRLLYREWIVLALAAWIAGCTSHAQPPKADQAGPVTKAGVLLIREDRGIRVPEDSPLRQSLQIVACEEQSVEPPIVVPGVVEADPARLIKVTPPVSGRIVQLYKRLGDAVRRGDALFALDSADVAQAYSDAAKAQAALNLARRNLDRQKELHTAGISPRKDLEQAESDHSQAASEAERSRVRLSLLGIELGQGNGHQYTMHSPITGHVIELSGAQGAFWNDTNAPIMTVANLSTVWLAANVQEKDIRSLFVGQPARITLDAYNGTLEGKYATWGRCSTLIPVR